MFVATPDDLRQHDVRKDDTTSLLDNYCLMDREYEAEHQCTPSAPSLKGTRTKSVPISSHIVGHDAQVRAALVHRLCWGRHLLSIARFVRIRLIVLRCHGDVLGVGLVDDNGQGYSTFTRRGGSFRESKSFRGC